MFGTIVSSAYWVLFAATGLMAATFLLGTFWRNTQFSTARGCVDHGSDDPESADYRIYQLSVRSGMLAAVACVTCILLGAGVILAYVAATILAKAVALAMVVVSAMIGDLLRERHSQYDAEFLKIHGTSVDDVCDAVLQRPSGTPLPARDDRPASLN